MMIRRNQLLTSKENSDCGPGQKGNHRPQTAIVLIAFVVVSSIFSFGPLHRPVLRDKSKETIRAGLKEASATLNVKGSILRTDRGRRGRRHRRDTLPGRQRRGAEAVNLTQGQRRGRLPRSFLTPPPGSRADDDTLVEEGEIERHPRGTGETPR